MRTEGTFGAADPDLFAALIDRVAADPANRDNGISDANRACPYAEIPRWTGEIRRFLAGQKLGPDDVTTLEVGNSVLGALTLLALLGDGRSFMTTPPRGQSSNAAGVRAEYPTFSRAVLSIAQPPPEVPLDSLAPADFLRLAPNADFDASAPRPLPDNPRMFFRTSGSTGAAKLAVYGYRAFFLNALNALAVRGFDASHRILLPTPIFHVYGLGAGFLAGLAGGSSIDLHERSNILRFFEHEARFDPNVAYVTPSFCEMLLRGRRRPRPYRYLITSGDRISESTFRRCEDLHGPMINQYGATELGIVAAGTLDMPLDVRAATVGRPVPGIEFRIAPLADTDDTGVGELRIRHRYGFEGYVDGSGNRLVPPKAFAGDWYRTGDLATANADGTLSVLGRCDLSVNRQGVLLPLAEVESRMRELDGVEEVAVAPGPENIRGRALIAYCTLARGASASPESLRSGYARVSPAYSVPEIVRIMHELPKLESGKIDRKALERLAATEQST